jgi:hypothetical protein
MNHIRLGIREGTRRLSMGLLCEPKEDQPSLPEQVRTQFVGAWVRSVMQGDFAPEIAPYLSSLNGQE